MQDLDRIRRIKEEAEAELLAIPGVTGVDVGYKHVGGKKTGVLAIRVYVEKKGDVPEENVVPQQIQGVPTDVIQRRFALFATDSRARAQGLPREDPEPSGEPRKEKGDLP